MALTADDIVNYPLKQTVRGYAVAQVDELLDQVAEELERRTREHEELRERLDRAERRLDESSETEATLKRTLVTAQRAAERSLEEARERAAGMVDDARREAAAIVEQARLEAEEARVESLHAVRAEEAEIRNRRNELEARVEALRVFEREMRKRLRTQLEDQLRALDEVGGAATATEPDADERPPVEPTAPAGAGPQRETTPPTAGPESAGDDRSTQPGADTGDDARDHGDEALEPLGDLWAAAAIGDEAGGDEPPGGMSG